MQSNLKGLGSYGTLGLEIALGVLLPAYVGYRVDEHLATRNVFLLAGFALGLAHGARAVYRALRQANREADADEARQRAERRRYHDERS